jgi:hypothetical protein
MRWSSNILFGIITNKLSRAREPELELFCWLELQLELEPSLPMLARVRLVDSPIPIIHRQMARQGVNQCLENYLKDIAFLLPM